MFTSDKIGEKRKVAKQGLVYMLLSVLCALVGAVYELLSHEVYSYFMLYAFAFPLCLGACPCIALSLLKTRIMPSQLVRRFYACGVATLTVGSIMNGVFEIYGTSNDMLIIYWSTGAALMVFGALSYFLGAVTAKKADGRF